MKITLILSIFSIGTILSAAPKSATKEAPVENRVIAGSVFAKGADQPYIFAGVKVVLLNGETMSAETTTDAQGKFTFSVAPGAYVLKCAGIREYRNGNKARYSWSIDLPADLDAAALVLSSENAKIGAGGPEVRISH